MRYWLASALLLALAVPAGPVLADPVPANQTVSRGECKRMTRQIAHFADVADRARERDNEKWEEHTLDHIQRLAQRRAELCPEYRGRDYGAEFRKMLKLAGKIALKLFTMGII